jgi:hypothetical protein
VVEEMSRLLIRMEDLVGTICPDIPISCHRVAMLWSNFQTPSSSSMIDLRCLVVTIDSFIRLFQTGVPFYRCDVELATIRSDTQCTNWVIPPLLG